MGNAVSRDHAKLPFGYTHARKDHSFNTSSVSRRRLATRLLRTSDTTSVTPFPIQDGASSVASIPELVALPPMPLSLNLHLNEPSSSLLSSSLPVLSSNSPGAAGTTFPPTFNSYGSYNSNSNSNNSNDLGMNSVSSSSVPESGTGATSGTTNNSVSTSTSSSSTTGASLNAVPEHDSNRLEACIRPSRSRTITATSLTLSRSTTLHSHAHPHPHPSQCPKTSGTIATFDPNNPAVMAPSSSTSGSSLAWTATTGTTSTTGTMSTNHPGMTHPDLAHASSPYPHTSNRYEHESFSLFQKQRQLQSMRTREEQDNDMDIISALGIADQPYQSSYDFFSSVPSPPRTSSLQQQQQQQQQQEQQQQQYHHPNQYLTPHYRPVLSAAAAGAMQLNGARMGQEDYETHIRTTGTTVGSDELSRHGSMRRALSYELRNNERELQHLQEDGEDDLVDQGEEDECALKLEGEVDSILDEDLEHLSPIPFSDLPSLTNIGLCSHGIVKLSSNIKLLASATCVQICCNELSRIPAEIGFLRNLTLLDLSKNSLTCLPDTIMNLTKLVDLKLSFNQLESIPVGIGELTKLAALSLENNRLQSIPSQIGKIKGLVSLDLSSNPITVLPAEIGKLQFLRRLKLDRCPLVEEFVHSPLHSPPTLLELAARVIVRHDVSVPPMVLPHLKAYIKSARTCSFCDGPYFDSWVKRGKMIEKNETFIPLEYTLCQPHWNTELERVKLLFCQRPVTSPPPKSAITSQQRSAGHTLTSKRTQTKSTASTSGANTGTSTSASDPVSTLSNTDSPSLSAATTPSNTSRPRGRKGTLEGGERDRPLSMIGNRLSMLLWPKADRRERPASAIITGLAPPTSSAATSSSSPSSSAMSNSEVSPRPTATRSATSAIMTKARLMKRRLSLGSALEFQPTSAS